MLSGLAYAALFTAVFGAPQNRAPFNQGPLMFQGNMRLGPNRRQGPQFPGGQFQDPMGIHYRNNFQQQNIGEKDEETGSQESGGFMSMLSAPRIYLNSMWDGVRNYFGEEEEEVKTPRRYPNNPRLPGGPLHQASFMNFRTAQMPYQNLLANEQNLLANGHRFQDINSVFQPPFNQFRGPPMGGLGAPQFPQQRPLTPFHPTSQHVFQGPLQNTQPQQGASGSRDGHWTGGYSSHYKQVLDQSDQRPIYHVTNTDSNSERQANHLTSTHEQQAIQPQEQVESTYIHLRRNDNQAFKPLKNPVSSYSGLRRSDNTNSDVIAFESEDASTLPQTIAWTDRAFMEST